VRNVGVILSGHGTTPTLEQAHKRKARTRPRPTPIAQHQHHRLYLEDTYKAAR
jgi:hypothetical protein